MSKTKDNKTGKVTLDFTCPFCKKEVQENEEIMLANSDDLDSFSLLDGAKTFIHVECYKKSKENDK